MDCGYDSSNYELSYVTSPFQDSNRPNWGRSERWEAGNEGKTGGCL